MKHDKIIEDLTAKAESMTKEQFLAEWREFTKDMTQEEINAFMEECIL